MAPATTIPLASNLYSGPLPLPPISVSYKRGVRGEARSGSVKVEEGRESARGEGKVEQRIGEETKGDHDMVMFDLF